MEPMDLSSLVAGRAVTGNDRLTVVNPFNGETVGTVTLADEHDVETAIQAALNQGKPLSRWERHRILETAREQLANQGEEFARLMSSESGLCLRETRYEIVRSTDVLRLAAQEALRDDGQCFAGDVSPQGKARRIFTLREPVSLAVAITPFNHPLNQVVHKVAPAIAVGAPLILKPSEKTPLTALKFAGLLHRAGLPPAMLSVLLGPTETVAAKLVTDERVEVVAFTGSVAIGKHLSRSAGYKRLVLELGGNDPLIVCADADLDLAARLAAEGAFRNSGQRCTAVKRILVDRRVLEDFQARFVPLAGEYAPGDPLNEATRVGTLIDEPAAVALQNGVEEAVALGARILLGGGRQGALLEPTVLADVPRHAGIVTAEAFGPLAPILAFEDIDDAIALANSTAYGLSAGVVTDSLAVAMQCVKRLRCGSVNINEVPGWRTEASPFGGIKDSGLGLKEGVVEAMKNFSRVKTFSLPW